MKTTKQSVELQYTVKGDSTSKADGANTKASLRRRLSADDLINEILPAEETRAVADLLRTARGAAMMLEGLFDMFGSEDPSVQSVTSGISAALFHACDCVDRDFFQSPGELAITLEKDVLAALLKKEFRELTKGGGA